VKKDWKEYEDYVKHRDAHRKHEHGEVLENEEHALLEQHFFQGPMRTVKPKRHMLILDDCQGSNVYTAARAGMLNHLAIKHRHVPLSICFLVQSWVGCPRTIRLNATHYAIFGTGDSTQLDQIYSCFANTVSREAFQEVYNEAISTPHGFLFIDVVPKKPFMRFREGFDTFLVVEKNNEIREVRAKTESANDDAHHT
jgi:hypothetical protein